MPTHAPMPKITAARSANVPRPLASEHAFVNFSLHVGERLVYVGSSEGWLMAGAVALDGTRLLGAELVDVCVGTVEGGAAATLLLTGKRFAALAPCCCERGARGIAVVVADDITAL